MTDENVRNPKNNIERILDTPSVIIMETLGRALNYIKDSFLYMLTVCLIITVQIYFSGVPSDQRFLSETCGPSYHQHKVY